MPMFGYMSHPQAFCHGVFGSFDFLNWIIYVLSNFKCFVILLLINI